MLKPNAIKVAKHSEIEKLHSEIEKLVAEFKAKVGVINKVETSVAAGLKKRKYIKRPNRAA